MVLEFVMKNFYPEKYKTDSLLEIRHNYLPEQFENSTEIINLIRKVVEIGDFTLGQSVDEFEENFAKKIGAGHAVGVGSGTDALFLVLKALVDQESGDKFEVITTPFTFYATIGAIATANFVPVFSDISIEDFNIDPSGISNKITQNTKAILPVHWAGRICRMDEINTIAKSHDLFVVEDACHAILASYKTKMAGTFGSAGCFSFHPLKNLNVWGDGGIVVTDSSALANKLRLLRNHGLIDRDTCSLFGFNSRLDTIQAVVANYLLKNRIDQITNSRINNAKLYDDGLKDLSSLKIPQRQTQLKEVFHLYSFLAENRDSLLEFLIRNGVDAKIHYPIPMHLQPAARKYGYARGDFPVAEYVTQNIISLPVHEFVKEYQINRVIELIRKFYS
jgi:dTDP-4-amino-4,6-dideoxygalactose transaminase